MSSQPKRIHRFLHNLQFHMMDVIDWRHLQIGRPASSLTTNDRRRHFIASCVIAVTITVIESQESIRKCHVASWLSEILIFTFSCQRPLCDANPPNIRR